MSIKGIYDIHCHIVPGVDDGATDIGETVKLLRMEYEQGVRTVIATPHFRFRMFETPAEKVREQFRLVEKAASEISPDLHVYLGCEFHANMEMLPMLREQKVMTMAGSRYVLTEFSHNSEESYIRERLGALLSGGYKPIMAHIERYEATRNSLDFVEELADMGVYMQINADSITGKDGFFSFPKKIVVNQVYKFIPNGIALEKYAFDLTIREKVRRDLGVENKFVIGHAGRFNVQKNHEYLIDVFASLHKECNDAVLLLFGDGELRESMQQKVKKLHLEESVHFMGTTNEMQKMYQAMDVFVMPSFCEGLPVAGVEAQASGLPVLLADTITKEVDVTDCVKYLPLSKDKSAWVKEIQSFRDFKRYSRIEELRKAGFDEKDVAKYFQNFYLNILDKL